MRVPVSGIVTDSRVPTHEQTMRNPGILLALLLPALATASGTMEAPLGQAGHNRIDRKPNIEPDYTDVTIPPNIAPMNFIIKEDGVSFNVTATSGSKEHQIDITSSDGVVRFPENSWGELLRESIGDSIAIRITASKTRGGPIEEYRPFHMIVSDDPIDPWLVYRLIHPGYYSWSEIKIVQRSIESFREESIIENKVLENNCANCHSFNNNSADRFLIHVRGSLGGTYFVEDGEITRTDPKLDAMPSGATYPSWHPDGRFVAFSSNEVRQSFYSMPGKAVEVYDLASSLILYDRINNETINITDSDSTPHLLTFPSWSPDGDFLYFCRAPLVIDFSNPQLEQIKNTHYDIARRSFDPQSRSFGETEIVFNASAINKSASFPRISPDGRFLIITVADYGTFPIWHREADLYLLDLLSGEYERMDVNSNETESYHTWSSNGRWLVFSSKRLDGRSGKPYFAHVDSVGNQGKEFVLPQEDPSLYSRMLKSFNIPEFVDGRIEVNPRDFVEAAKQKALKAKPGNPPDTTLMRSESDGVPLERESPIHE